MKLKTRVRGARTATRMTIMKAFCTLVMSVVIRVTRPGTLNLSMLEKEKVWMLSIDGLPQVGRQAGGGAGGKFAGQWRRKSG